MQPPPKQFDGANVLSWTAAVRHTRPTARTIHRAGGEVFGLAAALSICQYEGEQNCYLFHCDEEWNVRADTFHDSIDDTKRQAEFEYKGISTLWRPVASPTAIIDGL